MSSLSVSRIKAAFILTALLCVCGINAETSRFALVIGNAAYSGNAALKNPVNDATAMASALKQVGWNVTLATDVDRRSFNRAVSGFRDSLSAHEGADVLFFFAGHGMQADGNNYLIPVKTEFENLDDIKTDAISVQSVTDAIAQGKAGVSVLILDACRDNPYAKKMSRSLGGTRGLTVVQTGGGAAGSAIMFATSPGDVALDGTGQNGIFTSALLKYISGDLKLEDLFKKVTGDVRGQSAGAQNPWINASLQSDFYFISDDIRAARAAVAAKAAEETKQAEMAKVAESVRSAEAAKTLKAQKEAEAAKQETAAALAKAASEQNRPKGKVRVESSVAGQVFMGKDLLGSVGPDMPLMADSLATGRQDFRFVSGSAPDEIKSTNVSDKAYVVLLFGPAAPGRAAVGAAPGAIEVRVTLDTYLKIETVVASLDGGNEVELPHVFENVASGSHTIRIPDIHSGAKIYSGLEENVTVEPGKRLTFDRVLGVGKAKLRLENIPKGYVLHIDGNVQILTETPSGDMLFDGFVDSGTPPIEITRDNKTWYSNDTLPANGSLTCSMKDMSLQTTLQRRSISMKGKEEDWAGIDPLFSAPDDSRPAEKSGSIISGGSVCRDDKYLYIKIDFSDGKPSFTAQSSRMLTLHQSTPARPDVRFEVSTGKNGSAHSDIWVSSQNVSYGNGSYSVGASFIEMKFPLSLVSRYFDSSKPLDAYLGFWSEKEWSFTSRTPRINILIENK